jgi:hypothetical protein
VPHQKSWKAGEKIGRWALPEIPKLLKTWMLVQANKAIAAVNGENLAGMPVCADVLQSAAIEVSTAL